jgi:hypothetical protein
LLAGFYVISFLHRGTGIMHLLECIRERIYRVSRMQSPLYAAAPFFIGIAQVFFGLLERIQGVF